MGLLLILAGTAGVFVAGAEALGCIPFGAFFVMRAMNEPSASAELLAAVRGGPPPSGGTTA